MRPSVLALVVVVLIGCCVGALGYLVADAIAKNPYLLVLGTSGH